jgi:hypothetical protein
MFQKCTVKFYLNTGRMLRMAHTMLSPGGHLFLTVSPLS